MQPDSIQAHASVHTERLRHMSMVVNPTALLCRKVCGHLLKVLTHDRKAVCWPVHATGVAIKHQETFPATGTLPAFQGACAEMYSLATTCFRHSPSA